MKKTALLARVQRMSRKPHHKQNPLRMQGVSQKPWAVNRKAA